MATRYIKNTIKNAEPQSIKAMNDNFDYIYRKISESVSEKVISSIDVSTTDRPFITYDDDSFLRLKFTRDLYTGDISEVKNLNDGTYIAVGASGNLIFRSMVVTDWDMAATLKPVLSDLPAVRVSLNTDTSSESYIYNDTNDVSDIHIIITEESSKYYVSYSTTAQHYPLDEDSIGVEFTPTGGLISIKVFSQVRRDVTTDLVYGNFIITNRTKLPFYIEAINDDIENPRVTVVAAAGTVYANLTYL